MDKIEGKPSVKMIDTTRVYAEPFVKYLNGAISITNVEKTAYNSSYVTGVTDTAKAEQLWRMGRLLYQRYGVKTPYPKKLSEIEAIVTEADAIDYLYTQFAIGGAFPVNGTSALVKDRYTVSFKTSTEHVFGKGYTIGTGITFAFPNIANDGWAGYLTEIEYEYGTGKVILTGEYIAETSAVSEVLRILETDTATDRILETDTATDRYIEG
jgi:hypothetical protein